MHREGPVFRKRTLVFRVGQNFPTEGHYLDLTDIGKASSHFLFVALNRPLSSIVNLPLTSH